MKFQQELSDFKKKIDIEIAHYFDEAIICAKKTDFFSVQLLEYAKKITLSGGKRLRPALLFWSYKSFGGKKYNQAIKIAAAFEFLHMFFLIHDDVMDRGIFRHGEISLNQYFKEFGNKNFKNTDFENFGNSCAIIAGDMLYSIGNKLILDSKFDKKDIVLVLQKIQETIFNTAIGQMQDVYMEYDEKMIEKNILNMYENKTAKYTFNGPILAGALLAGKNIKEVEKCIYDFSVPIGIAFQIQDDVLGLFGDIKKTGKSSTSDLEEGKKTILIIKAFEKASVSQKKILKSIFGKKNISKKEVTNFQKIIIETGALEYAKNIIKINLNNARKNLDKIKFSKNNHILFKNMIDFMENREM